MHNEQHYTFQMTETPRHLVNWCLWHLLYEEHHSWLPPEVKKRNTDSPYLPAYKAVGLNSSRHYGKMGDNAAPRGRSGWLKDN